MSERRVRVRMYRVGFGECTLVTFPGPCHMLIDCGSLSEPDPLEPVVRDVLETTDRHVNLLVASHRHRDHISGFARHATLFGELNVDEVWLPWTESQGDPTAMGLRRRQDAVAASLMEGAEGELASIAYNNQTDLDAIEVLMDGFLGAPERHFLARRDEWMRCATLPGVRALVVGPARDDRVVEALELGTALAQTTIEVATARTEPFDDQWRITKRQARSLYGAELKAQPLIEDMTDHAHEDLFYWLDTTLNNTSLVLLFQFGTAAMLFPGDALGDAWIPFLEEPALLDLLRRVDLYKVAHHGSLSGTPARVAQGLGDAVSMLSTASEPWPEIPQDSVLKELRSHGPLARTDRKSRVKGFRSTPLYIETDSEC